MFLLNTIINKEITKTDLFCSESSSWNVKAQFVTKGHTNNNNYIHIELKLVCLRNQQFYIYFRCSVELVIYMNYCSVRLHSFHIRLIGEEVKRYVNKCIPLQQKTASQLKLKSGLRKL